MLIIRHQAAPVFPLSCAGNTVGGVLAPLLDVPDSMPCRAHDLVPGAPGSTPGAWHALALCVFDTKASATAFAVPGSVPPTGGIPATFPVVHEFSDLVAAAWQLVERRALCPVRCRQFRLP
jgi:hypothetical protein